jgi:hypothetical protein
MMMGPELFQPSLLDILLAMHSILWVMGQTRNTFWFFLNHSMLHSFWLKQEPCHFPHPGFLME